MATFKTIVDRISTSIKSTTKDDRVPKRYILNVFQSKLEYLLTQKLKDKSLFREDGLYTLVECLELKNIDTYSCDIVEFKSCNSLMKSKKKLPKIINSRFGAAIKSVTNVDYTINYTPTTPNAYRNSKLREEKIDRQTYYLQNGYPILPDSNTERINLEILTLEPYLISQVSECNSDKCKSYWDYEVPTSDKLTEIAIQETLKELLVGKQIPEDANPNLNPNEK
jgi:hypothetical protein